MKKLSKRSGLTTKPWHEKSIDECKEVISNLTNQNVNLFILKEKIQKRLPTTNYWYFANIFTELQGNITQLKHPYILFRFNPLNQNPNKKDQEKLLKERIGHDFNEDHMMMENELEFMYNAPTYQFVFGLLDIENVEDNNIYLYHWINFNPIPILGP